MKLGQIVKIYNLEFVYVRKDIHTYSFINTTTGDYNILFHSTYNSLIDKVESDKTFKELVHTPKWVLAKIYSSLNINYSLELK